MDFASTCVLLGLLSVLYNREPTSPRLEIMPVTEVMLTAVLDCFLGDTPFHGLWGWDHPALDSLDVSISSISSLGWCRLLRQASNCGMGAGDVGYGFIAVSHQTETCRRRWPRLLIDPSRQPSARQPGEISNGPQGGDEFPRIANEAITKMDFVQRSSLVRVDGAAKWASAAPLGGCSTQRH
jgi:hypothetical protein